VEVFDQAMRQRLLERHAIEGGLRRALAEDALAAHYQPIVVAASGELAGFEALVRWQRADDDLVPPAGFIEVAEQTGLIREVDVWMLRRACQDAAHWNSLDPDGRPLTVNVNLSARTLADDEFPQVAAGILDEWALPPYQIGLELTETVLLGRYDAGVHALSALREAGFRVALDDFGTGYSSLSYLQRLPLDELKLDRSFVQGMTAHERNRSIVATVVQLARILDLEAVGEGVETVGELDALGALGCRLAQGYLFSPPVAREACDAFVERLHVPPSG
jgi:EAL domain-containing protein (putative c-di-GMP-specific phosphodiesterase class I)